MFGNLQEGENTWEVKLGMFGILLEQGLGMFGTFQEYERGGWECLGSSRSREHPPESHERVFWECRVTLGSLWDSLSSSTHHAGSTP